MKYLIFEDFGGQPVAFLFPDKVAHADMREQLPYAKVLSAGYAVLKQGGFACFGGDKELDAHARPEDAAFIQTLFSEDRA